MPCAGALEGHLLLRSLPSLPNLPRPGDVAATELVAPPMFPLRAVATVEQPPAAFAPAPAPAAAHAVTAKPHAAGAKPHAAGTKAHAAGAKPHAAGAHHGAAKPHAASAHHAAAKPHAASAHHAAATAEGGEVGAQRGAPSSGGGFWQRLLARAGQQHKEEPVELLIRVDGRGLGNVRRAWVEGLPPGPAPAPGGAAPQASGTSGGSAEPPAAAPVAEVAIVQQPAPVLPSHSAAERPPLPVVGHLSAFVSW